MTKIKIDVKADVTSRLGFKPMPEFGNFCPAYLTGVEFTESESKEDAKWDFAGLKIPRLSFHFIQWKANMNDKDRFYTLAILPISTTKKNGEDMEEDMIVSFYNEMWKKIKHIHDQYATSKNYKELSFPEDLTFTPDANAEARLAEFESFFKAVVKAFMKGKDGKTPIFGEKEIVVLKLVASGPKANYLALPSYVGKGFIERCNVINGKLKTTLEFRPSEGVELGISSAGAASPQADGGLDLPDDIKAGLNLD